MVEVGRTVGVGVKLKVAVEEGSETGVSVAEGMGDGTVAGTGSGKVAGLGAHAASSKNAL